jgi:hypothetical protein
VSTRGDHFSEEAKALPNVFYKVQPQVLRNVLQTLQRAVAATAAVVGEARALEPRFTRQLAADFESARDAMPGSPRYDITHQPELPITNAEGIVVRYRRLDIRILFARQLGCAGDYLCLECKYLDATDRATDADYVDEGVERIVSGEYAARHPWAVMVGLERVGPLEVSVSHVDERLRARYGCEGGFTATPRVRLTFVRESEHAQAGGPHRITIVHAFFLITGPAPV